MLTNAPMEILIQETITAIVGVLVAALWHKLTAYASESKRWRRDLDDKVDTIGDATQATMRTSILHYCEKYLSRGWVTPEERQSLLDMHAKYVAINPNNGFIDGYMERVSMLPDRNI